jgi:hypothetical protein
MPINTAGFEIWLLSRNVLKLSRITLGLFSCHITALRCLFQCDILCSEALQEAVLCI